MKQQQREHTNRMYIEYFLINSVLNVQECTKYAKGENRCENDASSFLFFRFLNVVCVEYIPAVYLSFRVRRMPNTLKVSLHTGFNHTEADGSDASNQKRRLNSHTFTHSIYTAHAHTHTIVLFYPLARSHSLASIVKIFLVNSDSCVCVLMLPAAAPIHTDTESPKSHSHIQ